MKIRLFRPFTHQVSATEVRTYPPGVHDLDDRLASLALRFGKAEVVIEKKAPQNKARGKAPNNKAGVGRTTKRRSRARPKSDT